jgi:zinc protease
MKINKIITICVIFLMNSFIFAQENDEIKQYKLNNGIPVYYVHNENNEIDSVIINVQDGINYITPEYSGLQTATLALMQQGSKKYNFDYIQNYKYETLSSFSSYSDLKCSGLNVNSTSENMEESLDILIDCFMNPNMADTDFQKMLVEYNMGIQQLLNDPLQLSVYYTKKLLFKDNAMESSTSVTPDSIKNITLNEIKKYYNNFQDSRKLSVIAVVGMSPEDLLKILNQNLGKIKAQNTKIVNKEFTPIKFTEKPLVLTHEYAKNTGYIFRFFPDISPSDSDYFTTKVVELIYSDILYNVIRTKWGICYSVMKSDMSSFSNVGYELIYQCSDVTKIKEALTEAQNIMNNGKYIYSTDKDGIQHEKLYSESLEKFKNKLITSTFASQETTSGISFRILSSLELYGDTTTVNKNIDKIIQITPSDVDRVFKKTVMSSDNFWVGTVGPDDEEKLVNVFNK